MSSSSSVSSTSSSFSSSTPLDSTLPSSSSTSSSSSSSERREIFVPPPQKLQRTSSHNYLDWFLRAPNSGIIFVEKSEMQTNRTSEEEEEKETDKYFYSVCIRMETPNKNSGSSTTVSFSKSDKGKKFCVTANLINTLYLKVAKSLEENRKIIKGIEEFYEKIQDILRTEEVQKVYEESQKQYAEAIITLTEEKEFYKTVVKNIKDSLNDKSFLDNFKDWWNKQYSAFLDKHFEKE